MKAALLTLSNLLVGFWLMAENPKVPKQLDFADIRLVLTDDVIAEIQQDVDALRASPTHFQSKLDRLSLYFPIIERIFKEENVPDDFKYLAIQESGLVSDAVSSANAVGFWQFKDFTGREVGLRIDNRIDERKNIVSASRGAAKYLKRNNYMFDNWLYAMSAYQAGVGGAQKYVDKKDYGAKKMTITKDTHWYVKKYIAHKVAFQDELDTRHSEGFHLSEYERGKNKDLDEVAKEVKIESDLLRHYNKWIESGKIPEDKLYVVLLPLKNQLPSRILSEQNSTSTVNEPTRTIKETQPVSLPREIKTGITKTTAPVQIKINGVDAILASDMDDINSLAAHAGIPTKYLIKYNDLPPSEKIKSGQLYYIQKKKSSSEIGFHITKEGENLWSISQKYGIQLSDLAVKNRMDPTEQPKVNRVLWLNATRPVTLPVEYHVQGHADLVVEKPIINTESTRQASYIEMVKTVVPEMVASIEKSVEPSSTVEDTSLIDKADKSAETENTKIPAEGTDSDRFEKVGKTHVVLAGETLWSLSRKYAVTVDNIKTWNNMTKYDVLSINQVVFVEEPVLKEKKAAKTKPYTVQAGDTMYSIANKHQMDVSELMRINNKTSNALSVGEELLVVVK